MISEYQVWPVAGGQSQLRVPRSYNNPSRGQLSNSQHSTPNRGHFPVPGFNIPPPNASTGPRKGTPSRVNNRPGATQGPSVVISAAGGANHDPTNGPHPVHLKSAYKPGVIIRAPLAEQNKKNLAVTSYVTLTRCGEVHTKVQKMIVVGKCAKHYLAIPLHTRNRRGLAGRNDRNDHVTVRDYREPNLAPAESIHEPLTTEFLEHDVDPYHPLTSAHLNFVRCRSYDLECVIEGQLDKASTRRLLNLVKNKLAEPLNAGLASLEANPSMSNATGMPDSISMPDPPIINQPVAPVANMGQVPTGPRRMDPRFTTRVR